jgi:hypothetical protein
MADGQQITSNDYRYLPTRLELRGNHHQLADSSVVEAPAYFATLELVGLPLVRATITALGKYILGRRVIDRFSVTLDHGRRVIVKP